MSRHRRHRRTYAPSPWPARVISAAMVAGVVLLGVDVERRADTPAAPAPDTEQICDLLLSFLEMAAVGLSPPPNPTPEDYHATGRVNARLAQMTETLRHSEVTRKLRCP